MYVRPGAVGAATSPGAGGPLPRAARVRTTTSYYITILQSIHTYITTFTLSAKMGPPLADGSTDLEEARVGRNLSQVWNRPLW